MASADLVLEGGGVKGLGLLGAALQLLEGGYEFRRLAGTSAGAIVASLLASGATAPQLAEAMGRLDYRRVPDLARPRIPIASETVSLWVKAGAHPGNYAYEWIRQELDQLGVRTFADLRLEDDGLEASLPPNRRYKLVVTATDITNGRLLRLPWDYELFDRDPDKELVAEAVRASMSIPLYFAPRTLSNKRTGKVATLVDGGVLSNFPVGIFDRKDGVSPRWPTFGIKIMPVLPGDDSKLLPQLALPLPPPVRQLEQVLATALFGHDQTYIEQPCVHRRIINVDTNAVGVIEFTASKSKRDAVVKHGKQAAARFLAKWDWANYLAQCRGGTEPS